MKIGDYIRDSSNFEMHEAVNRGKSGEFSPGERETVGDFCRRHRAAITLLSQLHINIQAGYYVHKNPHGCINCDTIVGWSQALNFLEGMAGIESIEEDDRLKSPE